METVMTKQELDNELNAAEMDLQAEKQEALHRLSVVSLTHLCTYDRDTIKLTIDLIERL